MTKEIIGFVNNADEDYPHCRVVLGKGVFHVDSWKPFKVPGRVFPLPDKTFDLETMVFLEEMNR